VSSLGLGPERSRLAPPGVQPLDALVFVPSGMGAAFGTHLRVELPHPVSVTAHGAPGAAGASGAGASGAAGGGLRTTSQVEWTVPEGSTLRLQQLLAQQGYLPLGWHASGHDVERTPSAEAQAAVSAPKGAFAWRYGNTPPPAAGAVERGARKHDHARRPDEVRSPCSSTCRKRR
jgi:hypothetical protein